MSLKDTSVDFPSINHLLRVVIFHRWGSRGGVGDEHNVACHYRTSGLNVQEQLFSTCDISKALSSWRPLLPILEAEYRQDRLASRCLLVGRRENGPFRQGKDACVMTYHAPGAVDLLREPLPGKSKQMPVLASHQVGP